MPLLDTDSADAADADVSRPCQFVEVLLDGITLRLMTQNIAAIGFDTGAGTQTFRAADATYGQLGALGEITTGVDAATVRWKFQILPASNAARTALRAAISDDASVRWWTAWIGDDGQPVAAPTLKFAGQIEDGHTQRGPRRMSIDFTASTGAEGLHDSLAAFGLNDASHQVMFPGEKGLIFVSELNRPRYWGGKTPAGDTQTVAQVVTRNVVTRFFSGGR